MTSKSFADDIAQVLDERAGRVSEPEAAARAVLQRIDEDSRFAAELKRLFAKAKKAGKAKSANGAEDDDGD